MLECLGIQLDPGGLAILASPLGFFSAFSFPLMILVAFLCSELYDPIIRLVRRSARLGRLLDAAIAKGPREGWSGYVLLALTTILLCGTALWVFISIAG